MTRRTVLAALTGTLLLGALGAPALANPVSTNDERTTVCLRTDGGEGEREGYCVWVPIGS
jgi:hypothetical protein